MLVSVAMLAGTATARATYEGTPGMVASLGDDSQGWPLRLWDPATEASTTIEATTWDSSNMGTGTDVHGFEHTATSGDAPSAPSWSPDGSKFAYAKPITDGGDYVGLEHSAIFVYTVATGQTTKITSPEPAVLDKVPEFAPVIGHVVSDFAPAWSADGNTIAFVRNVAVHGPDDALYPQRGQNLWKVPAGGGGASQVSTFVQESAQRIQSGVWIPNSQDLVVSYFGPGLIPALGRQSSAGGTPQFITGSSSEAITDYDVSPDGTKLAYGVLGAGGVTPFVQPLGGGAAVAAGSGFGAILRFSGSDDGLLHSGCTSRSDSVCGLLDRLTPDNDADIQPGETDRLALAWDVPTPGSGGIPSRIAFDVQPQTLPIVFAPGFLGSQITCGATTLWPGVPHTDAPAMRLGLDGVTNEGCPSAGPNGSLVETVLSADIYQSIADFLRDTFPNGRATLFGWDWRKRPQESLTRLQTAIDAALDAPGPWKNQKAGRVVLAGHSYGGILIRVYAKEHPLKVARMLTLGTPYWGSPKAIFPLAYGIESPAFSPLDALFTDSELQQLAVNLGGLYQLYPSDRYGSWLSVDGAGQGATGISAFVFSIGGNTALLGQARGYHSSLYEGFFDNGGRIDVRAVVGSGEPTFTALDFVHQASGSSKVFVRLGTGDGTVPAKSAVQGPLGTNAPFGDPIHIQYRCGVDHVALAGDANMRNAYKDFLDFGRAPRKLQAPCESGGGLLEFSPGQLGIATTGRAGRADAGGPLSLADAEAAGLIDLVTLPEQVLAVTSASKPVTLRFTLTDGTFTWTPYTGETAGAQRVYGPLNGTVEVTSAGAGDPIVTVDGIPVTPQAPPPDPGGAVPTPTPGAGTPAPLPNPTASPTPSPAAPSSRFRLIGRPSLRRRTITLTLELPGPGVLALQASAKRGKRMLALGAQRTSVTTRGRRKLTLKLKRKPPAKVRLAVSFTPAGGAKRTQTVTVKRSHR